MPSARPVRAIVDTNIVISAFLSRRGAPHALLQALYAGAFRLVLSPQLREEYERVLARPGLARRFALTPDELAAFFRFLDRRAQPVTPREPFPGEVRDVQDAHVLAAALAAADYLVTGDDDLLVLADDPRLGTLQIVTVRVFLDGLGDSEQPPS